MRCSDDMGLTQSLDRDLAPLRRTRRRCSSTPAPRIRSSTTDPPASGIRATERGHSSSPTGRRSRAHGSRAVPFQGREGAPTVVFG